MRVVKSWSLVKPTNKSLSLLIALTKFWFCPSASDRVKYGMSVGGKGLGWDVNSSSLDRPTILYLSNMSLLLSLEPFQKFNVGGVGQKIRFGPILGL